MAAVVAALDDNKQHNGTQEKEDAAHNDGGVFVGHFVLEPWADDFSAQVGKRRGHYGAEVDEAPPRQVHLGGIEALSAGLDKVPVKRRCVGVGLLERDTARYTVRVLARRVRRHNVDALVGKLVRHVPKCVGKLDVGKVVVAQRDVVHILPVGVVRAKAHTGAQALEFVIGADYGRK